MLDRQSSRGAAAAYSVCPSSPDPGASSEGAGKGPPHAVTRTVAAPCGRYPPQLPVAGAVVARMAVSDDPTRPQLANDLSYSNQGWLTPRWTGIGVNGSRSSGTDRGAPPQVAAVGVCPLG